MNETTGPAAPLPSPDERPSADVVVFDGNCGICRTQIERLRQWDVGGRLAFVSLHEPLVSRRWPDLSQDRLMEEMAVVDQRGHHYWGAEAVRYLTRRLPHLWWLAPILHFPGSMLLWRPLYRWIAQHRYWLSRQHSDGICETGNCHVHRSSSRGHE